MKKLIAATALVIISVSLLAATYTVTWKPSTSPDVTGYRVYSSTNGTNWKFERGLSGTNVTLTNIAATVNFFGISATNPAGSESIKSVAEILSPPSDVQIISQ